MDKGWLQLLLVGVPVLMFIGAWMTLRYVTGGRRDDKRRKDERHH